MGPLRGRIVSISCCMSSDVATSGTAAISALVSFSSILLNRPSSSCWVGVGKASGSISPLPVSNGKRGCSKSGNSSKFLCASV